MKKERMRLTLGKQQEVDFSYCSQFGNSHLQRLVPASRTVRGLRLRGTSVSDNGLQCYLTHVEKFLGGPSPLELLDLSAIEKPLERGGNISDKALDILPVRLIYNL